MDGETYLMWLQVAVWNIMLEEPLVTNWQRLLSSVSDLWVRIELSTLATREMKRCRRFLLLCILEIARLV